MITAIIQARTGSTRLPNKIFASLMGEPLIYHVVERLKYSSLIKKIVIATTTNPNDDSLETWGRDHSVYVYRGSEDDVLARYYHAANQTQSSVVIRITADDPFKDPNVIDAVIRILLDHNLDFAYNNNPPSFPEGLDTEVFTFDALERAYNQSRDQFEREHMTQYMYRHPDKFRQENYQYNEDISHLRWTIDTAEDLLMVQEVYKELYIDQKIFLMNDILLLLKNKPSIAEINTHVKRSSMYQKIKRGNDEQNF